LCTLVKTTTIVGMLIRRSILIVALGISLTAPIANAQTSGPQVPIAVGPVESILEVIREADKCGLTRLDIRLDRNGSDDRMARLYLGGTPVETAYRCLRAWTAANWQRLNLDQDSSALLAHNRVL
jgi:hypothetical protein